ncbi:MFS transporter [Jatrophihabitans sp. YIM 134969]
MSHPETPGSAVRPSATPDDDPALDPTPGVAEGRASAVKFGLALRSGEFRALWFADTISAIGTQVSRVALSLLVYGETGSALASAAVFALTFLPTLIGGALLSGFADRVPRRGLMVGIDSVRTLLVACMALPFLPLPAVAVLVFFAVLLDSPFRAAQTALLPLVLEGEAYEVGTALRTITVQAAQLIGYGLGGLLVAWTNPRIGLAVDAVTFAIGALTVWIWVKPRPVPERERHHEGAFRDYLRGTTQAASIIVRSPSLRIFVSLALLSGVYVVPEGLAAPYAASIGAGSAAVGLLMACDSAGSALGAWLLIRIVPESLRHRSMAAMAILPGLILVPMLAHPSLWVTVLLWTLAGIFSVFQIPASVAFVREVPDSSRGQAMGLVISAMLTAQGVGVLLGGVVAEASEPIDAIVLFALVGAGWAAWLAVSWSRVRRRGASAGEAPGGAVPVQGQPEAAVDERA